MAVRKICEKKYENFCCSDVYLWMVVKENFSNLVLSTIKKAVEQLTYNEHVYIREEDNGRKITILT
jgi:hypothetical protein